MSSEKNMFNLEGKTALVTGASYGMGKDFAMTLAEAGANLVITARNRNLLEETEAELKKTGSRVLAVSADVSKPEDVSRMINQAVSEFKSLDIAINNAGIVSQPMRLHEMSLDDWQKVIDINLTGLFMCMQKEIAQMLKQGTGGSIVNNSSVLGLVGLDPDMKPRVNYVASKHGVNGLTKQGAVEYAEHNIRVNAIAPAWHSGTSLSNTRADVQTTKEQEEREKHLLARTPMGRRGRVEELQGLVLFLASDASSYVTGQIIASDGGWTAH